MPRAIVSMRTQKREIRAIILAAGKGTRMKSDKPKVLHEILGRPMVEYVVDACRGADVETIYVVVGYGAEQVRQVLGPEIEYVLQEPQQGTGHALMQVKPLVNKYRGDLLVLVGDSPFITPKLLADLVTKHRTTGAAATFLTAFFDDPPSYGRVLRDDQGKVLGIVEDTSRTPEVESIHEVNTSHYCFRAEIVLPLLSRLDRDNAQGEYYLTDIIGLLVKENHRVRTMQVTDNRFVFAINTLSELAEANDLMSKSGAFN